MSVKPEQQATPYEWLPLYTPDAAEQRACADLEDPMYRVENDLGLGKGQRMFEPLRSHYPELLAAPEHYGRGVLMFMQGDDGNDMVLPFLSSPPEMGGVEAHQTTAGKLRTVDARLQKHTYWSFHLWGNSDSYMIFANTGFYGGNVFDQPRKMRAAQRLSTMLPHLKHLVLDHSSGQLPTIHSRQTAA